LRFDDNLGRYLNLSEGPLTLSTGQRCHFGDFAVDRLIQSNWTQKMIDRTLNQLSNGVFEDQIQLKISQVMGVEVNSIFVFSSFHPQSSLICISKLHLIDLDPIEEL
jgi:hypothetical protein